MTITVDDPRGLCGATVELIRDDRVLGRYVVTAANLTTGVLTLAGVVRDAEPVRDRP